LRTDIEIVRVQCMTGDRWSLRDSKKRAHGPFDLLVVADGARSKLREMLPVSKSVRPYEWGALWFIGTDEGGTSSGTLRQHVRGTGKMIGLLPTGLGPKGDVPLVSMFYSQRSDRMEGWKLDAWKKDILEHVPAAEP